MPTFDLNGWIVPTGLGWLKGGRGLPVYFAMPF